jgi:hypothetical protein
MTVRQLASGETFRAAVIQDVREVAALPYNQSMMLIKRAVGHGQEVDSVTEMALTLNSWLLTGFLRTHYEQDTRQIGAKRKRKAL